MPSSIHPVNILPSTFSEVEQAAQVLLVLVNRTEPHLAHGALELRVVVIHASVRVVLALEEGKCYNYNSPALYQPSASPPSPVEQTGQAAASPLSLQSSGAFLLNKNHNHIVRLEHDVLTHLVVVKPLLLRQVNIAHLTAKLPVCPVYV